MPIVDQFGRPYTRPAATRASEAARQQLRARYDAAAISDANQRHWANADLLSGDAANNPAVRQRIRSRARYECYESNSFANGVIKLLAYYLIGDGPRLKMRTPDGREIQRSWRRWCRKVKLGRKLRTMRMAKAVDGEAIALLATNPRLDHEVKLDVKLREADQMTTPNLFAAERNRVDGVDFDDYENPLRYWFLKDHPGSNVLSANPLEAHPVDARHVIHWFRQDRPGVRRGVSEIAPSLPLFAIVRRYVLAVLGAAEAAAENSTVMYTDSPALDKVSEVDPMDVIELEMRAMLTLPAGWKMGQLKAEQPTTTFEMFRNALWNEVARCVLMPFNIAAGNSAGYNFASGKLDHQAFDLSIDTDRSDCEDEALEPIFEAWLREYLSLKSGIAPSDIDLSLYDHRWYWPPKEHIDPLKTASAVKILWEMGLLTDEEYWFQEGYDSDDQYEALERQQQRREQLGLPTPGAAAGGAPADDPSDADPNDADDEEGSDEDGSDADTDQSDAEDLVEAALA